MFKKIVLAIVTFVASVGFAFAQVDVNKADQAALDSIKGIGPSISKKILDERKTGGDFKDWMDFEKRVKGVGDKNSVKFSQAGLTVNGQAKPNAPAVKDAKPKVDVVKDAKAADAVDATKDAKATKKEAKAAAKAAKAAAKKDAASDVKKDDVKK